MSQYVPAAAASPYAYRLPPDTFLSRRDPGWYIGATEPAPQFKDQISAARSALLELRVIGNTVQRASTDPGTAEAGRMAAVFASETGPRLVSEAEAAGDVLKLARVQGATKRIIEVLKPDVVPALITRFVMLALVGPAGVLVSADTLSKAKEAASGQVDEAFAAGKEALKTGARGVVKLGQEVAKEGMEQLAEDPLSTVVLVGAAAAVLALYFYIKK